MLIFDLVSLNTQRLRARRAPDCDAHRRAGQPAPPAAPSSSKCSSPRSPKRTPPGSRSSTCAMRANAPTNRCPSPSLNLPMSKLLTDAATLDTNARYLLICATGKRSAAAADLLRSQGFRECRSLRGGLKGLKAPA